MNPRRTFAPVALSLVIALAAPAAAETGMGLVVDKTSKTMRRIDLLDGAVAYTTPAFGSNAKHGRFNPDGTGLAFIDESGKVFVCDLSGESCSSFTAWSTGTVSWTSSGIWVGDYGRVVLYDPDNGDELRTVIPDHPAPDTVRISTVSHSETAAGARITPPGTAAAVLLDDGNRVVEFGGGCGVGPFPSGTKFTHNLWESDYEHQTMKLHDRSGAQTDYFYFYDLIPYPEGTTEAERKSFTWNTQTWSSNAEDVILIPSGRGFPQMTDSAMPWIYDLTTQTAHCLHDDPYASNVFWYIQDYHRGKNGPHPAPPAVDAGPDRSAAVFAAIWLDATVADDGFGDDTVSYAWSMVSGPSDPVIDTPTAVDTAVTFGTVGTYVLRLTVTDGALVASDDVQVIAEEPQPAAINIATPRSGDRVEAGGTIVIEWDTSSVHDVVIAFSNDGRQSWAPLVGSLDDSQPEWGAYTWQVPEARCSECYIRIAGYFGESPTEVGPFEIVGAEDLTDYGPVVLVGGCAAAGPSSPALLAVFLLWLRRRRR